MATLHPLPSVQDLLGIFTMLYSNDVEITSAAPLNLDADKVMVAVFLCDDDKPVCACVFDYKFAAFSGCALTRIPPGGAEDAADTGDFSAQMLGNVNEVMNISSRLLMNSNSPHIRLGEIYHSSDKVPEDVMAVLKACDGSEAFDIDIPNYGSGNITFLAS